MGPVVYKADGIKLEITDKFIEYMKEKDPNNTGGWKDIKFITGVGSVNGNINIHVLNYLNMYGYDAYFYPSRDVNGHQLEYHTIIHKSLFKKEYSDINCDLYPNHVPVKGPNRRIYFRYL
jgi:hypothetical protein